LTDFASGAQLGSMLILKERPISEAEQKTRLIMWERTRKIVPVNPDGSAIIPTKAIPKRKSDIRWF